MKTQVTDVSMEETIGRNIPNKVIDQVPITTNAEIVVAMVMAAVRKESDGLDNCMPKARAINRAYKLGQAIRDLYECTDAEFFVLLNRELKYFMSREDVEEMNKHE